MYTMWQILHVGNYYLFVADTYTNVANITCEQILPFCRLIYIHNVVNVICERILYFCRLIHKHNVANITFLWVDT